MEATETTKTWMPAFTSVKNKLKDTQSVTNKATPKA